MQDIRTRLIEATFQEVFLHGYNAASLANILKRADTKKGSMYHYFASKKEMVIVMIEEKIEKRIENKWQKLQENEEKLLDSLIFIIQDIDQWDLENGCPLGNLLQESLNKDEEFSKILTSILDNWKNIFISILQKAQDKNELKKDTNIQECATFLIASIEGALLLSKKYDHNKDFKACAKQLTFYINSLRTEK